MKRFREGLTLVAIAGFLGAIPASADEARGFRAPPGTHRPAPAPPLRLAEGLSAEPLARLAPAAVAARAELAEMEAWNRNPRNPSRVGFARILAEPLRLELDPQRLGSQMGLRVGGGFLSRERGGRFVWGTSVEVEGANALRLELSQVNLPAGTRLWVYGSTGESKAFDLRRLRSDGSLVSPVIEADRIHLEVELPDGPLAAGQGFVVRQVREIVHSRGTVAPMAPTADSCLRNAECYDSSDFPAIEAARDGVIQYIFSSGGLDYACSAGLLDDNAPSTLEPWILTANHCLSTQDEAESIDAVFFYRYASCAGTNSTYSSSIFGADLVVTSEDSDVTLMRAIDPDEVPDGVHYLSWTSIRPGNGTVLHRISHPIRESDDALLPQQYSKHQIDDTPENVCTGYPVSRYLHTLNLENTGISFGSSGSPIFRPDGYVVGQLLGSCGDDPNGCGTDENTLDGAFASSYPLLRPYLSPEGPVVCIRDADTACLLDGEIRVEVTWHTASGSGPAQIMYFNGQRAENEESAFFWFFNPTNFEMGVKAVDACVPPFNHYWVFVSGLTSQGYDVTVTKMSTGEQQFYTNEIDEIPTTDADTTAFDCN